MALPISPLLRFLLATLALLTLVRWALAATWDVTPAEAYLYQLAAHRTWLGCEGGGGGMFVAGWAVWLGKSALALRFWMPLVALASSWQLFRLVKQMAHERAAAWAVVLLNLLPDFNFGAVFLDPTWLATLLGLAGMQWLWTGLHRAGTWDWHWPAAGGLWGLALLTHGSAVNFPLALGFLLLASRRWRKRLRRPGVWLLLGAWFLVGILPLVWWNATHADALLDHWLSQLHWQTAGTWSMAALWEYAVRLALASSPLLLATFCLVVLRLLRHTPRDDASYFLLAFSVPGMIWLGMLALSGLQPAAGIASLTPALCGLLALVWQPSTDLRQRRNLWQWLTLASTAALTLALLHTDLLRQAGLLRDDRGDRARHWLGWQATAAEAAHVLQDASTEFPQGLLLIAETPDLAAELDFYLPPNAPIARYPSNAPRIQVLESPVPLSQYSFWPRYDEEISPIDAPDAPTALFFTDVTHRTAPPGILEQSFGQVTPLMVYEIHRHGSLLRRIKVFACRDYHGAPL